MIDAGRACTRAPERRRPSINEIGFVVEECFTTVLCHSRVRLKEVSAKIPDHKSTGTLIVRVAATSQQEVEVGAPCGPFRVHVYAVCDNQHEPNKPLANCTRLSPGPAFLKVELDKPPVSFVTENRDCIFCSGLLQQTFASARPADRAVVN